MKHKCGMAEFEKKEHQLFERWKSERGYPAFISDGIFDAAKWSEQSIKITFVLKEANWIGGNCDLCQFLLDGLSSTYWKTWNNVARWSKALLEGGDYPYYVSNQDKTDWLSRVSFINLKKVGGTHRANNKELREYAKRDGVFINQQLELYQPDIIICCGRWIVADILYSDVFSHHKTSEWQMPIYDTNYFYVHIDGKKDAVPVVSFVHPQRIGSHELYMDWYSKMSGIGKELLANKNTL